MRLCDLQTGNKRLQSATKALREKWLDTKEHWDDQTAQKFEEQYLRPLGEKVRMALGAVDRLTEVLQQAEGELSDRDSAEF